MVLRNEDTQPAEDFADYEDPEVMAVMENYNQNKSPQTARKNITDIFTFLLLLSFISLFDYPSHSNTTNAKRDTDNATQDVERIPHAVEVTRVLSVASTKYVVLCFKVALASHETTEGVTFFYYGPSKLGSQSFHVTRGPP